MKIQPQKIAGCIAISILFFLFASVSYSANRAWSGLHGTDWSDDNAWGGSTPTAPANDLTTDIARFLGAAAWNARPERYDVNLDEDRSVSGVDFGAATGGHGGFLIDSTVNATLTIGSSGIRSYSMQNSGVTNPRGNGNDFINVNVVAGTSSNQTFIQLLNNGTLTMNGSVNFNIANGKYYTIDVAENATLVSNGAIIINDDTVGTMRLIKDGAGLWEINHDNRATLTKLGGTGGQGDLRFQGGTIAISSNGALGNARITNNPSTDLSEGALYDRALIVTEAGITVDNGGFNFLPGGKGGQTLTIGGNHSSGVSVFDSGIMLLSRAGNTTSEADWATRVTAATGGTVIIHNRIGDASSTLDERSGSIRKVGGGTVIFTNGGNNYSAKGMTYGTIVEEGTLLFNNTSGSGAGETDVLVEAGAGSGGSGAISGSMLLRDGASLLVGYESVGGFSIGGNLTLEGDLTVAYGSIGTLAVGGVLDLGGNTLTFDLSGYSGESFNLVTWEEIVGDATTDVVVTGLNDSLYSLNYGTNGIEVAIPEPATYAALMALAALAFIACRRRR